MGGRGPVIDDVDAVRDAGARAHYDDPAYYDLAYRARKRDVAYYVLLAKRHGGPVLEYGVGNGRVALSLARAGFDVVGVDLSERMLASLAQKRARGGAAVETVLGDMRERVAAYVDEHKVPPQSLADLGYEFAPDREVKKLELVAGDIHLTLAVPAVEGRKLRLRALRGGYGQVSWTCEAPDLPPAYTPARCRVAP